jgi:lysozyme family protein
MDTNFAAALSAIWRYDGFKDDHAPGEKFATTYGVTQMTWNYAVEHGVVASKDVGLATEADCEKIYRALYWQTCRCDELPSGVDLMVFNDACLSGVGHTIALVQRLVGVDDDGVLGPLSMAAIGAVPPSDMIGRMRRADKTYLTGLRNAPRFLTGWTRREDEMAAQALAMVTT